MNTAFIFRSWGEGEILFLNLSNKLCETSLLSSELCVLEQSTSNREVPGSISCSALLFLLKKQILRLIEIGSRLGKQLGKCSDEEN